MRVGYFGGYFDGRFGCCLSENAQQEHRTWFP